MKSKELKKNAASCWVVSPWRAPLRALVSSSALIIGLTLLTMPASAEPKNALAMHGEPALPPDFSHIPYTNPDAPKGGRIVYGMPGSFDSMNPYILNGTAPRGMNDWMLGDNVYERLMFRSRNEPFTLYSFIAETVEVPDDRSWIEFHLNPKAAFSDGNPVTVDDIIGTIDLLKEKGRPNYRRFYNTIDKTEKVGERGVRFTFNAESDREAPLLLALMPVLPATHLDWDSFDQSSMKLIPGTGPYVVGEVDAGNRLVLQRNENYWAKDHPVKRGFDNFDEIIIDYYREDTALFEAFKKGLIDMFDENDPQRWKEGYTFPAAQEGRAVQRIFEQATPAGMKAFVFNTRRAVFADPEVREAIASLFDFDWVNENLLFDLFDRTSSYFERSALSAAGLAASDAEKALLAPFPEAVRPDVMDGSYQPTKADGSGRDRQVMQAALQTLKGKGWTVQDGVMRSASGEPVVFEILVRSALEERLALAFQNMLKPVGIEATIRLVDSAQYFERLKSFDFDMTTNTWYASLSPGREQLFRWASDSADTEGTFNYAGVTSAAVDAMMDAMLQARDRDDFVAAIRALDRVLISGSYVVPLYHAQGQWVGMSSKIGVPDVTSIYGYRPDSWWSTETN